jgi:hypothetical protein
MAVGTHRGGVVRNRKPGMVECRARPGGRRVASLARSRKPRRQVIRIRRALIVRLVAGVAIRGRARVFAPNVATGARNIHVRAGEREARLGVIE